MVREVYENELSKLLELYLHLHEEMIAENTNCYKMMLLTGSKKEETMNFYGNAGYNSTDKTAFIQWLE